MSKASHRSPKGQYSPRDHYSEVTSQIIAALEAGTPPWRKPWDTSKAGNLGIPCNAVTGMRYRGINVLTLATSPLALAAADPRWATYKQAADRAWQVRKGARGTTAYFFKRIEVSDPRQNTEHDEDGKTRYIPLLRAFTLFHASQIEGVPEFAPPSATEAPWRASDAAGTIVTSSRVTVRIGGDRAFYALGTDHIQMPPRHVFPSAEGWCSTVLHELGHATGHPSRLNRDLRNSFGSPDYAREELRAEIAQVMVCAELGIGECEFTNGAAYIASWLETLRSDRKEIFRASADAQRIADYLLALHPDYAARHLDGMISAEDAPAATSVGQANSALAAK
jgi:antirestriction protein ArdC